MKLNISSDELSALKFVKGPPRGQVTGPFPDFLILGPQRTSTTWLTKNLRYHPDIRLSFPKELYYFSRLNNPDKNRSLHYSNFDWSLAVKRPSDFFREAIKILYFEIYKGRLQSADRLDRYLRFFEQDRLTRLVMKAEGEYIGASSGNDAKIGEATASYAALAPEIINEIVALNPNIKAIIIVRNPIERAWSHAMKDLVRDRGRKITDVPEVEFFNFFSSPYQRLCGNYTRNIENWKNHLKPGNLLLTSYDEIQSDPGRVVKLVFDFLAVRIDDIYIGDKINNVINKSTTSKIPAVYQNYLENLFAEDLEALNNFYGFSWRAQSKA